jgi:hypothetical protein
MLQLVLRGTTTLSVSSPHAEAAVGVAGAGLHLEVRDSPCAPQALAGDDKFGYGSTSGIELANCRSIIICTRRSI